MTQEVIVETTVTGPVGLDGGGGGGGGREVGGGGGGLLQPCWQEVTVMVEVV